MTNADELRDLVAALTETSALIELGVLAGCLFVAWGLGPVNAMGGLA